MNDKKGFSVMLIMGVLIAASAMAAFVSHRKHVMESCKDIRIAMDGSYVAVVESGGLNPSTELTIYQEHNRKRVKVEKMVVDPKPSKEGQTVYVGSTVKLIMTNKTQASTGRTIASLQGEVRGEKVSATLSCTN